MVTTTTAPAPAATSPTADPGDCIVVDMAVSSEKIALLTELAEDFNDSDGAAVGERCVFVRPRSVASGQRRQPDRRRWPNPEVNGEPPVIWSPAAVRLGGHRQPAGRADPGARGNPVHAHAARHRHAPTDGRGARLAGGALGFADLLELANDPEGWGAVGHPEWGPFRLGKTNPNYSTSGLNFTIAEYYAATGKTAGLTTEDLARPAAVDFATQIESSVVHYGDITMTFLNNWFAADSATRRSPTRAPSPSRRRASSTTTSAIPTACSRPARSRGCPAIPLVAIYPEEGTLFSDSPFIVLDTEWVDDDERAAAALFEEYVQRPENQQKVLEFGFRPNNPAVPLARPDRRRERRRSRAADDGARGARARRAGRDPRLVGRAAQGRTGAARARHLGLDGRPGGRRHGPSSTSPRRRR